MKSSTRCIQVKSVSTLPQANPGHLSLPAGGLQLCPVIRYDRTLLAFVLLSLRSTEVLMPCGLALDQWRREMIDKCFLFFPLWMVLRCTSWGFQMFFIGLTSLSSKSGSQLSEHSSIDFLFFPIFTLFDSQLLFPGITFPNKLLSNMLFTQLLLLEKPVLR